MAKRSKKPVQKSNLQTPKCGLCSKTKNLTQTDCCGEWICDDEDNYVLFSYARNSCSRNHRRFTLCGHHSSERHSGNWQTCQECRDNIETEMYVYYGTNEYNFEKLAKPPDFKPTHCAKCQKVISLSEDEYVISGDEYFCIECPNLKWQFD